MRFICAIVKLVTYRVGRRLEQFSDLIGGDE